MPAPAAVSIAFAPGAMTCAFCGEGALDTRNNARSSITCSMLDRICSVGNPNDLWTMRAATADVQPQQRGFRTVNVYQAGDTAYTIRSNERPVSACKWR